eukprot:TRINITY_DN2011_c0_g1_i2.p2 TRINITY_DN2011_c0_g1~~TRINITY_DN2011_c0_g1_i2.p2  ORF type:complete len:337 (-),score=57.10 TRINITY_DN2011_c0_g1_i2:94-1104(-)
MDEQVREAEEYQNIMMLLDEIFTSAILRNRITRVGLQKEKVYTEEQKNNIYAWERKEIQINHKYQDYKNKIKELVSEKNSFNKQLKLVDEAKDYLEDMKCKEIQFCENYNEKCECIQCAQGYFINPTTQKCELYLQSCAEYKQVMGSDFKDGIYTLELPSAKQAFDVYCEGEWIVLLRRVKSDLSFYRDWNTYVEGFGELDDAFWLGLEKMHALTIEPKTMKVDLWAGEEYVSDEYNGFTIGDSETKYTLHLNFVGGNAGNSFSGHDNQKFSTYDQDNDTWIYNCAVEYPSGWWFSNCHSTDLNGIYGNDLYAKGVCYSSFKGYYQSLTKAIIKIK